MIAVTQSPSLTCALRHVHWLSRSSGCFTGSIPGCLLGLVLCRLAYSCSTATHTVLMSRVLSNCLSNVQTTSTNIQRYCTVHNRFFNRFGETGNRTTWQLLTKLLLVKMKEPDWQVFSTNQNTPPYSSCTTCHATRLASFLFVQICLQNSLSKRLGNK